MNCILDAINSIKVNKAEKYNKECVLLILNREVREDLINKVLF